MPKNPFKKGAAWMEGKIIPIEKAKIQVNDWGLVHSDITYDVVPVCDGAFFRLEDYIARFQKSIQSLKMNIKMNNVEKKINNSEKKVLIEMLSNPGKTFSRDQIGKISGINQERSIDVMITRLRQKIEINPKNPKYLQTIRGSGYVLWIE